MSFNLILFNKPFRCLSQFSANDGKDHLGNYIKHKGFYPAGRLDYDSEGLLVLTNNGKLQAKITDPKYAKQKTYLAQVEGNISQSALRNLCQGVYLKDGLTRPAQAKKVSTPTQLWSRTPPIRYRKNITDSWLKLSITEGKNRQVRRMLASVGFPCLRLVRVSVGDWQLQNLSVGQMQCLKTSL